MRKSLEGLFDALMSLPTEFTGLAFGNQDDVVPGVERVYIGRREDWAAPAFNTPSSGYVMRLNRSKLVEKLAKTYVCEGPVDLIAYVPEIAHVQDESEIPYLIRMLLASSGYRCIWVFEELQRRVTVFDRRDPVLD